MKGINKVRVSKLKARVDLNKKLRTIKKIAIVEEVLKELHLEYMECFKKDEPRFVLACEIKHYKSIIKNLKEGK